MPRASKTTMRARQQSTRAESDASALRQALREKKRIQDRESQRNVRQRTRNYIASLEAQIVELQSPTCTAQLLAANEQLTAKVNELTATIEAISKLIQILSGTENTHAAQATPGSSNGPSRPSAALPSVQTNMGAVEEESSRETLPTPPQHFDCEQRPSTAFCPVPGIASPTEPPPLNSSTVLPDVLDPSNITPQTSNTIPERQNGVLSTEYPHFPSGREDSFLPAGLSQTADARRHAGDPTNTAMPNAPLGAWDSGADHSFDSMVVESGYNFGTTFSNFNTDTIMDTGDCTESSGSSSGDFVLGSPGNHPPALESDFLCPVDSPHIRIDASHNPQSDHESSIVLSQIGPPTSLWETQIIDSIKLYQSLVAETPDAPIFESENLDIRIFIQTIYTSWKSTPLTRLLVDAIQRWNFDIPERLGIYWLNYLYIKYRASPAKYTCCMPEWFLPCVSQCIASHPIYIDTLPWPALRNKLSFEHEDYPFSKFVAPFCNSLDVNWKLSPKDTYDVNPDGSMTLSDAFVAHLRKLENWSLGPMFASNFPELAMYCKK